MKTVVIKDSEGRELGVLTCPIEYNTNINYYYTDHKYIISGLEHKTKEWKAVNNGQDTMKFQKGNSGRPKGSKNKKTVLMDAFIKNIVNEGQAKFHEELSKLSGTAYLDRYMQLIEYVTPKLARQEVKQETTLQIPNKIEIDFKD